jgi:hypothetical protein
VFTLSLKIHIIRLEVRKMNERWTVQTEKGDSSTNAVWAALEEVSGRKTASVVLDASSRAAVCILSSGMFYLEGPDLEKPALFRIEGCTRARIEGCMFLKAVEAFDTVRSRENSILREMRKLLQLDMLESYEKAGAAAILHTQAS